MLCCTTVTHESGCNCVASCVPVLACPRIASTLRGWWGVVSHHVRCHRRHRGRRHTTAATAVAITTTAAAGAGDGAPDTCRHVPCGTSVLNRRIGFRGSGHLPWAHHRQTRTRCEGRDFRPIFSVAHVLRPQWCSLVARRVHGATRVGVQSGGRAGGSLRVCRHCRAWRHAFRCFGCAAHTALIFYSSGHQPTPLVWFHRSAR
jgi:hypothetical protein